MGCKYCEMMTGKVRAAKIYEDEKVAAFLANTPATIGHVIVMPREHSPIFEAINDETVNHMFKIVNNISVSIFESIKSEGTNIIIQNGVAAGQEEPHFCVHIIARKQGDGLIYEWSPKQLSEEEMSAIEQQLREELSAPAVKKVKTQVDEGVKAEGIVSEANVSSEPDALKRKEQSYLLKQLKRMP